jgi:Domain of unknown function (DUF4345)
MTRVNVGEARAAEPVGEQNWHAVAFVHVLRVLAAVPLLVGLLHMTLGVAADLQLGAALAPELLRDPVLDSQDRFQGAVFMGYGALLYLCLTDLRSYAAVFRIVSASIALGGVARLLSIALHGLPPPPVLGLIGVEVVLVPLLLTWHSRVLGSR